MQVTILGMDKRLTFTQRGSQSDRGFVRVKGKTISGYVWKGPSGTQYFEPNWGAKNEDALYSE